ncbi:molecular chaperone DnaJ [Actinoalloteichus hymeniacidonis]|uniref:Chaperone protein DnaJ n=1 Tax=Actinoalloteichus hymeniacidonis TaxID=340345 RepID=A0AAC9HV90_9PSEU|nr:molecular chaperone DnaJ [Actinoalloteichus hymeniacidonis]AOS66053.1 DnaJ-class molecular chaperone with C-terminal Zn finger domain [Actinoalloteichus hymeniacidonis]MBB5905844.1 molecular chaperone DnaJ [Actinoalloteichus hymeniacidonis]
MSARDWIEKDFYAELGVPPDASADEVKRSYRKLARELHPDANPGDTKAETRFKAVSEAYGVLSDGDKRKQYDEARRLFGGGGGGFRPGGNFEGFGNSTFDFSDMFANRGGAAAGGAGGGIGDILGGLFGKQRGAQAGGTRPQRGADVETEIRIDFVEAIRGATVPLRLSSPASCTTCHGSGARPGSTPKTCTTCSGAGVVTRSQGAFAFSEPCRDCRGSGRLIDDPCPECGGEGVSTQTRTLTVRIPGGVTDNQRIRLASQGEPGRRGAAAGDLYVRVHVTPHPVFGREGDDLTLVLPVTFPELTMGATLSVPTLDGRVSVKVAPGTASGRVLRVRGRGIAKRDGSSGDLLVTLQVTVPSRLDGPAEEALRNYAEVTADHDPRAELTRLLDEGQRG